jgi:glycerol kinase
MAGLGTGVWDSMDDLRETWKLDREFTPDESEDVAERTEAAYALWHKGVERAKEWSE